MNSNLTRNVRWAFALCLFFLGISSAASFISIQSLLSSSKMVNNTHSAIRELETVLSTVKDAEAGLRGYLITENVKYLKPYEDAKESIWKRLEKVKVLIENPEQQVSTRQLEGLVQAYLQESKRLIQLKQIQKLDSASSLDLEKDLVDKTRLLVKSMQLKEYELLNVRTASLNKFSTFSPLLIILVAIMAFIITVSFYYKVKRDLEIRNALQRERGLTQRKDEFLSIASHELKTPITNMKGYLQLLEKMSLKEGNLKYQNFILKAIKQADKLTSLVGDLLNVSKIQAGKLDYNISSFRLGDIIEDVIAFAGQMSPHHRVAVKGETDFFIEADKNRIEQVISNFISNAIKYAPGSPEILLEINRSDPHFVEVSVTDFGIGIPEEKLEQIFSRFYRVEDKASFASGLGIGLYICKEIIQRHDGQISVKSEPGKGSTFTFAIPLKVEKRQIA